MSDQRILRLRRTPATAVRYVWTVALLAASISSRRELDALSSVRAPHKRLTTNGEKTP